MERETITITPGRGIGKLALGMSEKQAIVAMGKPNDRINVGMSTHTKPKPIKTPYTRLFWQDKSARGEDAMSAGIYAYIKSGKIVQLAAQSGRCEMANGISTTSRFAEIRKEHPKITVASGYFGSEDEPGYVGYFFIVRERGVTFNSGTQDSMYDTLPDTVVDAITIHPTGKPPLWIQSDLVGLVDYPDKSEEATKITRWFQTGKK
jgi:hypothetical protein